MNIFPICVTLPFRDRRGASSQKTRQNHSSYPIRYGFRAGAEAIQYSLHIALVVTFQFFFSVSLNSPLELLSSEIHRSKVTIRQKKCIGTSKLQRCASKAKFTRELLLNKWVNHFTQAQLKRNQDFVVSILNIWILQGRPLAVALDKGNAGAGDEMGHLRFRPSTVNERPPASVTIN